MTGAPSIPQLIVGHWQPSAALSAEAALVAGLYVLAAARSAAASPGGRGWPLSRTLAFVAGIVAITVALQSGIDRYDDQLLSVHMVQHLLLLEVAPALLLLGRPVHLALRVLPPRERRALGRGLVRGRRFATPAVCLLTFSAVTLGTHVPAFFDATLRDQTLHDAEHIAYLLAGLLMWWPLFGDPAPAARLRDLGRLGYVIVAMLPMTLIGAYLDRAQSLVYPGYAAPAHQLGISAVTDQQQAGAIMWVAGTVLMAALGLASVVAAMVAAERRQQARELRADAAAAQQRVGAAR